ncbi:MAG: hypothetical protein MUF87_19165 [Anaerolineae bacterium]|jgi:hypothetical protein|nr:hypothetical protein [Anaerolineae bacterium]
MSKQITLMYTANLRGDLTVLPRLWTWLKAHRPDYLIDLGESCASEVWHCAVTGGRSMLIALDGLGYHAVNASQLAPDDRDRLAEGLLSTALIAPGYRRIKDYCVFSVEPIERAGLLNVILTPATDTHLDGTRLFLASVMQGQIGSVTILWGDLPTLHDHTIHTIPPDTPPDATISGIVDFVLSEARYYQKRSTDAL